MSKCKVHLWKKETGTNPLCGTTPRIGPGRNVTGNRNNVTCKKCLDKMKVPRPKKKKVKKKAAIYMHLRTDSIGTTLCKQVVGPTHSTAASNLVFCPACKVKMKPKKKTIQHKSGRPCGNKLGGVVSVRWANVTCPDCLKQKLDVIDWQVQAEELRVEVEELHASNKELQELLTPTRICASRSDDVTHCGNAFDSGDETVVHQWGKTTCPKCLKHAPNKYKDQGILTRSDLVGAVKALRTECETLHAGKDSLAAKLSKQSNELTLAQDRAEVNRSLLEKEREVTFKLRNKNNTLCTDLAAGQTAIGRLTIALERGIDDED